MIKATKSNVILGRPISMLTCIFFMLNEGSFWWIKARKQPQFPNSFQSSINDRLGQRVELAQINRFREINANIIIIFFLVSLFICYYSCTWEVFKFSHFVTSHITHRGIVENGIKFWTIGHKWPMNMWTLFYFCFLVFERIVELYKSFGCIAKDSSIINKNSNSVILKRKHFVSRGYFNSDK